MNAEISEFAGFGDSLFKMSLANLIGEVGYDRYCYVILKSSSRLNTDQT